MKRIVLFSMLSVLGSILVISCSKKGSGAGTTTDTTAATIKYIDTLAPSVAMKHPGGLHSQADFDRVKAKVNGNVEPWLSGWNKLIANSHAQVTYTASPTAKLIRGGNSVEEPLSDNYSKAMNDAAAAYQLGLRWKISGNAAFAQAAINILNAWADNCTMISGDPNMVLAAGIYGYEFAVAGELLRDYSGWQAADFKDYQQWMLKVFYTVNHSFLVAHMNCNALHTWSNWDLCNLASVMAIGILSDNRVIYNEAINYIQRGSGNGNIFRTINFVYNDQGLAQMQESGRDQGHCTLSLALLTTICQLAWNQGDDLWGFDNNRILKASEYVAKYNVAGLTVPFTNYSWYPNCTTATTELTSIGTDGKGTVRPMWAMIYNHYVKIKGKTATYTAMGVQTTKPEGGGGDYGSTSGGFDQLGFGSLMYTME